MANRAPAGERASLGCSNAIGYSNQPGQFNARSTERQKGADEKVETDRGVGSFHLRHSRLTGLKPPGQGGLGQAIPLATRSKADSQCQFHLDETSFVGTQREEVPGIADPPVGSLKTLLLLRFHREYSLTIFKYAANRRRQLVMTDFGVASDFFEKTSRMTTASRSRW